MNKCIRSTSRIKLIILIVFATYNVSSQVIEQIDSLVKINNNLNNNKQKVIICLQISDLYHEYDVEKSLKYAYIAINISKKINYPNGIALAYLQVSQTFRIKKDFENALKITYKSHEMFEKYQDIDGISKAQFELGFIYKNIPNYYKAEKAFIYSYKYYVSKKDTLNINKCLTQLGHLELFRIENKIDTLDFQKALKYYLRVLELEQKRNNYSRLTAAYINLSNLYTVQCNFKYSEKLIQQGIEYALLGVKYAQLCNSSIYEGISLGNVAEAYFVKKNTKKSIEYYQKSHAIIQKEQNLVYMNILNQMIIDLYFETHEFDKAYKILQEYFYTSTQLKDKTAICKYYEKLTKYYLLKKNFKQAYFAQLNFEKYNDSVINEEKRNSILNIEMQYKVYEKDIVLNTLKKDKALTSVLIEQESTFKKYLIISAVLILILFVLYYNRLLLKLKSEKTIANKNKELETLSIVTKEARNGILITDNKGVFEWYNEEFSKIHQLQLSLENEPKKSVFEISKNESIQNIIDECIKTLHPKEFELKIEQNQKVFWLKTNISPIFDTYDNVHKLVFVETDITELVKTKETAENALLLQEQFLANTSHEIRTPMNGIIGMTNQFLTTEIDYEQSEYLQAIKDSSNNLMYIINEILDISKIKAGKFELENIPFKINDILKSIKLNFNLKAKEKNIQFNKKLDPKIPYILKGDPTRLYQILNNFINNAIKFTEKGSVTLEINVLELNEMKCMLEFNIIDTGIGIANEKLEYIFEAFSQAESNTNRVFGGTGLGLTITKSIIEMLGGTISIKSKLNVGSTFSFKLEFALGSKLDLIDKIKTKQKLPKEINLSHLNILMVEDNIINQKVSLFVLNKWKATTDIASNPIEAFELLEKRTYDLILMDISMPIMNGIEATINIRKNKNEKIRNIPIIALTASALNSEKIKCIEAGMDDYISKPFNSEILYLKIVKWTEEGYKESRNLLK